MGSRGRSGGGGGGMVGTGAAAVPASTINAVTSAVGAGGLPLSNVSTRAVRGTDPNIGGPSVDVTIRVPRSHPGYRTITRRYIGTTNTPSNAISDALRSRGGGFMGGATLGGDAHQLNIRIPRPRRKDKK